MNYLDVIVQILSSTFGIMLPFGFSYGILVVFLFSLPLLVRLLKKIF